MSLDVKAAINVKQALPLFWVADMEESLRLYVGPRVQHNPQVDRRGKAALVLAGTRLSGADAARVRKQRHDSWVPEAKVGIGVESASNANLRWRSTAKSPREEFWLANRSSGIVSG
jgi:hypothetical protein